jgi:ribonucleoside-triphosphate reductase
MDIQLKLSKDFERFLEELKQKYGEDFEYINGLHPSQLDFSEFINNFVGHDTLADASIDPNANANTKDIRSFMTEKGKSEDKLFGLNKIFMEIKKMWGLRTAKQWLEQEFSRGFYLNDSTTASYFPYCWANDFTRLATEGLFFLQNYNNQAPKHLTTYFDDVFEFVSFLSNRQSGAVGMPNVLIWAWYFWKKDVEGGYYMKDPEYYLRQQFQKFIFRLNQPFLRIDQSAFTNVSIFDRRYIESIFGGVEFPDGTLAIEHVEDLINAQKVFMEVVSETREINMFTYPVKVIAA